MIRKFKKMRYSPVRKTKILYEGTKKGFKILIVSLGTHPCAYIGLPKNHLLEGIGYNDFNEFGYNDNEYVDFACNGGLTYSDYGVKDLHPKTWFFGWDYAHAGDFMGYTAISSPNDKKWTTEEIYVQCLNVIDDIERIYLGEKVVKVYKQREEKNEK